jgi:hypothetical protein
MNQKPLQRLAALAIASVSLYPALAQTKTPPPTCTTAPTTITALNFERALTLTSVSSTTTPTIPTTLQPGLTSGALELRQNFTLNTSSGNVITITEFAAQPTSGFPTPPQNISFNNVVSTEVFNVTNIFSSCQPTPSLLVVGTITQNFPVSPVGNLIGVPAALSIGYTNTNPPTINNVVIVYAGIAAVYSASATGTLTLPTSSVAPPGSTNANSPVITVAGGITQGTAQKIIVLDATGSTSPAKLPLTFTILQVAPPNDPNPADQLAATVTQTANGVATITFLGHQGTYYFTVTATDSAGNKSTQTVAINYAGL